MSPALGRPGGPSEQPRPRVWTVQPRDTFSNGSDPSPSAQEKEWGPGRTWWDTAPALRRFCLVQQLRVCACVCVCCVHTWPHTFTPAYPHILRIAFV